MAEILPVIASVIGIAGGAKNLFGGGGGGGGGGGSNVYQPQNQGGADAAWSQFMKQLQASLSTLPPEYANAIAQSFQSQMGAIPGVQQAAGAVQPYYNALGNLGQEFQTLLQNAGGQAGTQAGNLYGAGNQLWQTALDPQGALKARLEQETQDASRAGTSARGIGMSPQAAGIEGDTMSRFFQDWENQQLQRQTTGLQGMSGAFGQAGNLQNLEGRLLGGSMEMGQQVPGMYLQGAMLPYQMAGLPGQAASTAAGQTSSSVWGPWQSFMSSLLPYMNLGQNASQIGFGQQQTGLNNMTTGLQQFGQNAPGMWNSFANLFGGGGGNMGYGMGSNFPSIPFNPGSGAADTTFPNYGVGG